MSHITTPMESFVTDRMIAEVESCMRMVRIRELLASDSVSVKEAWQEIQKENDLLNQIIQGLRDFHELDLKEI